jgi:ethanolamine utilization cobalamin adenosyltransferase
VGFIKKEEKKERKRKKASKSGDIIRVQKFRSILREAELTACQLSRKPYG